MNERDKLAARICESAKMLRDADTDTAAALLDVLASTATACVAQLGVHAPKDWLERLYPKSRPTTEAEYEEAANRA